MIRITEKKLFGTIQVENDLTGDALTIRHDEAGAMAGIIEGAMSATAYEDRENLQMVINHLKLAADVEAEKMEDA